MYIVNNNNNNNNNNKLVTPVCVRCSCGEAVESSAGAGHPAAGCRDRTQFTGEATRTCTSPQRRRRTCLPTTTMIANQIIIPGTHLS